MWITRDQNGELRLFSNQPTLSSDGCTWTSNDPADPGMPLTNSELMGSVTFDNSPQPAKIVTLARLKRIEDENSMAYSNGYLVGRRRGSR